MMAKEHCLFACVIALMLSAPAIAAYETLAGISSESPEYNEYKLCVDSCSSCAENCKTNTYRRAAETQQKGDFCSQLPEAERAMCLNRIYASKAAVSKDAAECQKITEETEKNSCLLNVQTEKAIEKESESECSSLPEGFSEGCRQAFYMRMASLKADESYCAKIADETAKAICTDTAKMQKGAAPPALAEKTAPAASEEPITAKMPSKSLIIYGIIIFGVILLAVAGAIIIKRTRKPKAVQPPLVVQKPTAPPLVVQNQQATQQQSLQNAQQISR